MVFIHAEYLAKKEVAGGGGQNRTGTFSKRTNSLSSTQAYGQLQQFYLKYTFLFSFIQQ